MCGIAGIVRSDGAQIDRDLLARMNDAIRHRGPDDDGFYFGDGAGLAMRRLAIIDLKGGHQPIHNSDRTAWIVFNGEIYNYRELRKQLEARGHQFYTDSDTEAIVHAYDEYGTDCPNHLRGMFAFAIWDERARSLFLARDRVGKKPLLYAQVNGQLIFGSEFMALLQHPDVSRDVNYEAIHHYLSFICVPAPLTAYQAIRKLQPGHSLLWKNGEIKLERYWQLDFSCKIWISEEEAGERVIDLLRDAVRVRLMSEVPLGAFLSGGIDSSAVVALMAQESSEKVKTFSIGFEEQDFSELHHARRVAEYVGAEHHEFIVAASLGPVQRYLRWVSAFDEQAKSNLYSNDFRNQTAAFSTIGFIEPWFAKANGAGIVDASLLTDTMTYLPNDLLVKMDIASMTVSLEARSPFLDHHLMEFAASLPEGLKLRGMTTKYLLKRILKKFDPEENLTRAKMGFGVPIGHWFRGTMQPFLRETLLSEKAGARGLFNRDRVRDLIEQHTANKMNHEHRLWSLLMVELWFQRFID